MLTCMVSHALANLPRFEPRSYAELKEDIRRHGLRLAILVTDRRGPRWSPPRTGMPRAWHRLSPDRAEGRRGPLTVERVARGAPEQVEQVERG
jgi:hypothetical protein